MINICKLDFQLLELKVIIKTISMILNILNTSEKLISILKEIVHFKYLRIEPFLSF
jgi:hypothetical protein